MPPSELEAVTATDEPDTWLTKKRGPCPAYRGHAIHGCCLHTTPTLTYCCGCKQIMPGGAR